MRSFLFIFILNHDLAFIYECFIINTVILDTKLKICHDSGINGMNQQAK